jgi:hypothetical protein
VVEFFTANGAADRHILRRSDRAVVGLVARRDLLRVRVDHARSETEREAINWLRGNKPKMSA